MNRSFLVVLLVVGACAGLFAAPPPKVPTAAPASPAAEAFREARRTLERGAIESREAAESGSGSPAESRRHSQLQNALHRLTDVETALASGQYEQALRVATSVAGSGLPAEAERAVRDLVERISEERRAASARAVAEVEATLRKAADAVLAARGPEDLDPTLERVGKLEADFRDGGRRSEEFQALSQRMGNVRRALSEWQTYFHELKRNDPKRAYEALRNLSQNDYGMILPIPRSEMLKRLSDARDSSEKPASSGESKDPSRPSARSSKTVGDRTAGVSPGSVAADRVREIVEGIQRLDELPVSLAKAEDVARSGESSGPRSGSLYTLSRLRQAAGQVRAADAGAVRLEEVLTLGRSEDGFPHVTARLKRELVAEMAPVLVQAPAGAKPAAGETAVAFAARVRADALARRDWPLAARCTYLIARLTDARDGWSRQESWEAPPWSFLIAGENFERAGQWAAAVHSYLGALRSGSPETPVEFLAERLNALKSERPDAYREGSQALLFPAGSRPPSADPARDGK